jgi:tetratricopeptide (TPR) repeat protein
MTKHILSFITITIAAAAPSTSVAQSAQLSGTAKWADSAAREIDRATIAGNLDRLRQARSLLDRALAAYPNDALLLHYEGYELYRESGLPLVAATARTKLEQSLTAQSLIAQQIPETHALLASVMGRLIAADRSTAPTLGPLIQKHMAAALASGPANPRVWLLHGIQSFYTDPQWGGGLPVAETQFNRAIELFATDNPVPPAPSWGRAEAYVWLGQVLQREKRPTEARAAYDKALSLERDYPWVTYSLLPSLGRK